MTGAEGEQSVYGALAAEHLNHPRNLGKLDPADGVGRVDDPATDTMVSVYLRLQRRPSGRRVVGAARFRAFGCGGCIVTGSVATELVIGLAVEDVPTVDGATINRALEDGLPPDQRYCAELAARALRLAAEAASRE
jgi:nitrogen fixation NifU-like protein